MSGPARAVLRRLAAGNPRYLGEILASAVAGAALRDTGGIWQWYGGLRGDGYLGELIEARLAGCDRAGRAVVKQLALAEPLPLAMLEPDPGLVDAERAGLVEVFTDGRRRLVRLAEPVHAEVVRGGLGPVRVRAAYRTLAARLRACTVPELFPACELAFVPCRHDRRRGCSAVVLDRGSGVRLVAAAGAGRVRDGGRVDGAAPRGRGAAPSGQQAAAVLDGAGGAVGVGPWSTA